MREREIDIRESDALELLRSIPDKEVDLIVTDPPYFFENTKGGGAFGSDNREYHQDLDPLSSGISTEVLEEMYRVMRMPNIYIWCNIAQIPQYLNFFIKKGCRFDILTWHKTNPPPMCSNKYLSDTEYCLFFRKGAKLYGSYSTKGKYWISPLNVADKEKYGHPTCKPEKIIRTLVENSSQRGELVCDPYLGSGTTAAVCAQIGRRFIGGDISPDYVRISKDRLKNRTISDFM